MSTVTAIATAGADTAIATVGPVSSKKRYRKDKPWDTADINHWAPVSVDRESSPLPPPVEESSFATLFPRYREAYLREVWPLVTSTLAHYGIACELDLVEGSMTVRTTRRCWDCSMILKARDVIKLLARSIPAQQAFKVLDDRTYCDIIKVKNLVRNKERFVKRRQRLIGPNGCTLKAIELVTDCYVLVQGNTVSAIGSLHGIKAVRRIVEDCMRNIHPIYAIKVLMIKRQLADDPALKEENWDRFLPKFTKQNVQRKKPLVVKVKQAYTPFPPAQQPRQLDLQIESGEYFLKEQERQEIRDREKRQQREGKRQEKKRQREHEFVPPDERPSLGHSQPQTMTVVESDPGSEETQRKKKRTKRDPGPDTPSETAAPAAATAPASLDVSSLQLKLRTSVRTGKAKMDAKQFVLGGQAQ